MDRAEYLAVLDTEPATPNQRGAVMREFSRLGFHYRHDRAERLAICATMLGVDSLGSTAELTQGQAGQLVNALQRIGDRDELLTAAGLACADAGELAEHDGQNLTEPGNDDQDHVDELDGASESSSERMTWPQLVTRLVAVMYAIVHGNADAGQDAADPPTFK